MTRRPFPLIISMLLALGLNVAHAQRLAVSPRLLTFPCTVEGERSGLPITISNNGPVPLRIRGYALPPGSPFIAPQGNYTIPPGRFRVDTIWFAPRGPGKIWKETLRVLAASDFDTVALIGTSSPPPGVIPRPSSLNFKDVPGLDTAEQCLILENPSCKPVVITDLRLNDPDFRLLNPPSLPFTLSGRERLQICVELLPGGPGPVNGRLSVETDLPGNRGFNVQIQGSRARPGLQIVPSRGVDFGEVPVNVISRELRVGVTNLGPNLVTIADEWELTGPDSGEFIIYPPLLPAQLRPGGADTLWFAMRFAPSTEGPKVADLRAGPGFLNVPVARLRGTGTRQGLTGSPLNIDMGELLVGSSRTAPDTLLLHNAGTEPVDITRVDITDRNEGFTAIGLSSIRLEPNESIRYGITFAPTEVKSYGSTLTFHLSDGALLPVRIIGTGVARERYRFWIDSATADVNQRFELHLRTTPDLAALEGITGYAVTLRFAPTSLYLHGATASNGAASTTSHIGEDTVVIRHTGTSIISGPILATLSFEGLVTGRQDNIVELIEVALDGDTSKGSVWRNGQVTLRGCDIGFGVGFGRPVMARAMWPAPASDRVTIRYIAPVDSRPGLRIIDLTGREQSGASLPAGTGSEQEATVDLHDLDPGFYILELRSGSGRSSLPIVIDR